MDASRQLLSLYICNDHTFTFKSTINLNAGIKLISCFNFCVFAILHMNKVTRIYVNKTYIWFYIYKKYNTHYIYNIHTL